MAKKKKDLFFTTSHVDKTKIIMRKCSPYICKISIIRIKKKNKKKE